MKKLLAIIRREYVQGVRSKSFVVSTALGPVFMLFFLVVPGLMMSIRTGGATRVAVVDLTEGSRLYEPVRESLLGTSDETDEEDAAGLSVGPRPTPSKPRVPSGGAFDVKFEVEDARPGGRPLDDIKKELDGRVLREELDAYLVLPPDTLAGGRAEYHARNTGDLITVGSLRNRLSRAVIEQRMRDENIDRRRVRELSRNVGVGTIKVSEGGGREEGGGSFFLALGVATFILISLLMYGQAILSAVVEEKTTRIVEVLFSSVKAFTLMAGKIVGVSLVALTQYTVWALLFLVAGLYGAGALAASGVPFSLPRLDPSFLIYALLFFLVGFYVYATIYAVVGAIVTTEKEAGQIIIPVSFFLAIAVYLAFPVIRNPGSPFSFWVSMVPFFSPITMLVRILTETPPFWQIALSLAVGAATIVLLIWLAARIYRTGMLMYGKRASLPEVLRWVRQS